MDTITTIKHVAQRGGHIVTVKHDECLTFVTLTDKITQQSVSITRRYPDCNVAIISWVGCGNYGTIKDAGTVINLLTVAKEVANFLEALPISSEEMINGRK